MTTYVTEPPMVKLLSYWDIVTLTAWMADNGYTAEEVAHAVDRPDHFLAELADAKDARDNMGAS